MWMMSKENYFNKIRNTVFKKGRLGTRISLDTFAKFYFSDKVLQICADLDADCNSGQSEDIYTYNKYET